MLNVEKRVSANAAAYCCCDTTLCAPTVSELPVCFSLCDVYFAVRRTECLPQELCFIYTGGGVLHDSPQESPFGYIFTFNHDVIAQPVVRNSLLIPFIFATLCLVHVW